ncbi:hypothetical protein ACOSQ3_017957 [Xanthoceras sorbifolium]
MIKASSDLEMRMVTWMMMACKQHTVPALISLLNGYRAACHYGTELTGVLDAVSCHNIQDSETFCNILKVMLREADNIFRGMLGISSLKLQEGNHHFGSEEMNTSKIKMENSEATDQVLSKKYPVHVESGN